MLSAQKKTPTVTRVKAKSPVQKSPGGTGKDISSSKDKSKSSERDKEKERNKVERNVSVTSDLLPGGSTSEVLRKLNLFKEGGAREESPEIEPQPGELSESESSDAEFDPNNCDLITTFAVKEDINKNGLVRGKKGFKLRTGGKRYQMEDTNYCSFPFQKSKDFGLFCVFDGHAGKECATELTKVFPKSFAQHWSQHNKDRKKLDITQIWLDVYKEVDEQLIKFEDEGSTATTLLIWRAADGKRYLQCANVGDSTAFLCRDGRPLSLSQDHKPTNKLERKRIASMGIQLEPEQTRLNGLAVSRAFGDHFAKSVDCGIIGEPFLCSLIELTAKDTKVILASDGLWDGVTGQRACDLIKSVRDPTVAAKKLLSTAVKSHKCNDNVTVVVINLR